MNATTPVRTGGVSDALYESLRNAWNQQDGDGMAGAFADHETASFVWKVRSARALGSGVALLRAVAGMVPPGQSDINPDVNTHHPPGQQERSRVADRSFPEHARPVPWTAGVE